MNTPVSYKLAKLLKEKGFDEQNLTIYQDGEVLLLRSTISNSQFMTSRNYTAPTIADVVTWIYEKHEIWVYPRPVLDKDGEWIFKGYVKLMANFKAKEIQTKLMRQPTEAYEAAIEYTLNNLI